MSRPAIDGKKKLYYIRLSLVVVDIFKVLINFASLKSDVMFKVFQGNRNELDADIIMVCGKINVLRMKLTWT